MKRYRLESMYAHLVSMKYQGHLNVKVRTWENSAQIYMEHLSYTRNNE